MRTGEGWRCSSAGGNPSRDPKAFKPFFHFSFMPKRTKPKKKKKKPAPKPSPEPQPEPQPEAEPAAEALEEEWESGEEVY